ncbi:MAG: RodZ domain-containing protein [Candidatus Omnitrophota bacterium]
MAKLKKPGDGNISSQLVMGTIGERLKSARENKRLSLDDVYRIIKIHPKTLEALEKGQLEDKLGGTYVRAFLKNYATFLGLDAVAILEEDSLKKHAAMPGGSPQPSMDSQKKPVSKKNDAELLRAVMMIAAIIASFFILIFGTIKISQFAKNTFSKIKTGAISRKRSEPAKKSPKPVALKTQTASEKIIPIPKQKALTLTLNTSDEVWLKVTVDGKIAFNNTLSKKSKETWKAEKEIKLDEIGKPEALKMNVNGKDIDFSKSRTRNILITHEGVDLEPK